MHKTNCAISNELLPFDCLHVKIFFIPSHNVVSSGWKKLILSIYGHDVIIHLKVCYWYIVPQIEHGFSFLKFYIKVTSH